MKIENKDPLIIPAQEEKVYDLFWVSEMKVTIPSNTSGSISFRYIPYSSSTGEQASSEHAKVMNIPLWEVVKDVPVAALAMGAVLSSFVDIKQWQDLRIEAAKAEAEARQNEFLALSGDV